MLKLTEWSLIGRGGFNDFVIRKPGIVFKIRGTLHGHSKIPDGTRVTTDFVIIITKLPNRTRSTAYTLDGGEFLLGAPASEYKEFVMTKKGMS